jgi:hypothetical protein
LSFGGLAEAEEAALAERLLTQAMLILLAALAVEEVLIFIIGSLPLRWGPLKQ